MLLRSNPVTVDPFRPLPFLPRRFRGSFLVLFVFGAIALLFRLNHLSSSIQNDLLIVLQDLLQPEGWYPPRFYEWHDREKQLPQHDLDLPYPQGREGRYIRFSNHVWGAFRSRRQVGHGTQLKY
jgi:hypothetical protein